MGKRTIQYHHPECPTSWNLLIVTLSAGRKVPKTKIEFKDKHKGLSSPNAWELTARIMMVGLGLITLRRKRVIVGTSNSFDNLEKFSALLDK